MHEDKTIVEFNAKLCDIENEAHVLGEKFPEQKLARKLLRSLLERFSYKVTVIEDAKDITTM